MSPKKPLELYLFGEVDVQMSKNIVGMLTEVKDLKVYLLTDGGDYSHAIAIYDEIRLIPNSTVVCTGIVASAGITILQAFKHRLSRLNTQFMVHKTDWEVIGAPPNSKPNMVEEEIKFGKHLDDLQFDLLAKRMGISNARMAFGEGIFGAERAFKLNMIDSVVE